MISMGYLSGESTPSYLFHNAISIKRIKAIAPQTKLLIMLRDPVDRAYSQFQMTQSLDGDAGQVFCERYASFHLHV